MENKIKHFIVDLDEFKDEFAYNSDENKLIEKTIEQLRTIATYRNNN